MSELNPPGVCAMICIIVLFITFLIIFIACFETIEIAQYGILYNTWTMELTNEPRAPGRFWLGLGKEFVLYPKNLLDFEFKDSDGNAKTLTAWSNNGLNVYVELSYYYMINPEKLTDFYLEFGYEW